MPVVTFYPCVRSRLRRIHADLGSCEGILRRVPEMDDYLALPDHLREKLARLKGGIADALHLSGEIVFELNPVTGRRQ